MLKQHIAAAADLSCRVADVYNTEPNVRVRVLALVMLLGGEAGIHNIPLDLVLEALADCYMDAANFAEENNGIRH